MSIKINEQTIWGEFVNTDIPSVGCLHLINDTIKPTTTGSNPHKIKEHFLTKSQYNTKKTNNQLESFVKYHITDNLPNPITTDKDKIVNVTDGEYSLSDGYATKYEVWGVMDELCTLVDSNKLGYLIYEYEDGTITRRFVTKNDIRRTNNEYNAIKCLHCPINNKVTSLWSIFGDCTKLKSIDTTNWDTSSVTSMSKTFEGCKSLETLDLISFNTS